MKEYKIEDIQAAMNKVTLTYPKLCRKTDSEIEEDSKIISTVFNMLVDALEGHLPKV